MKTLSITQLQNQLRDAMIESDLYYQHEINKYTNDANILRYIHELLKTGKYESINQMYGDRDFINDLYDFYYTPITVEQMFMKQK